MGYGGHETSMAAHETSKAMGSHESSKFYQYGYEGSSIAEATALAPPATVTHFRTIHETMTELKPTTVVETMEVTRTMLETMTEVKPTTVVHIKDVTQTMFETMLVPTTIFKTKTDEVTSTATATEIKTAVVTSVWVSKEIIDRTRTVEHTLTSEIVPTATATVTSHLVETATATATVVSVFDCAKLCASQGLQTGAAYSPSSSQHVQATAAAQATEASGYGSMEYESSVYGYKRSLRKRRLSTRH